MPKVTDEYREARRDEITAAAMRVFHRKGFQSASMADIMAESGLSAGAIYGHFKGRADIVLAVAERIIGARALEVEEIARRTPMPPPGTLVRVLMDAMLAEVGKPALLVQLWGEAVTDPALLGLATTVIGRLRGVLARYLSLWQQREHGLSPEDADALAARQVPLFLAAAQGCIFQSALVEGFDRDAYLATVEEFLPR